MGPARPGRGRRSPPSRSSAATRKRIAPPSARWRSRPPSRSSPSGAAPSGTFSRAADGSLGEVMDVRPSRALHFPPFRLDPDNASLWRGTTEVHLTPKAFAVLHCLVERHGQLVTKDALMERVWP